MKKIIESILSFNKSQNLAFYSSQNDINVSTKIEKKKEQGITNQLLPSSIEIPQNSTLFKYSVNLIRPAFSQQLEV
jgi:hypothetical protein